MLFQNGLSILKRTQMTWPIRIYHKQQLKFSEYRIQWIVEIPYMSPSCPKANVPTTSPIWAKTIEFVWYNSRLQTQSSSLTGVLSL